MCSVYSEMFSMNGSIFRIINTRWTNGSLLKLISFVLGHFLIYSKNCNTIMCYLLYIAATTPNRVPGLIWKLDLNHSLW